MNVEILLGLLQNFPIGKQVFIDIPNYGRISAVCGIYVDKEDDVVILGVKQP